MNFNRRHRQSSRLFQNRCQSILCQEDTYLLEPVRHIHLNPIRAGFVVDIKVLDYPFLLLGGQGVGIYNGEPGAKAQYLSACG